MSSKMTSAPAAVKSAPASASREMTGADKPEHHHARGSGGGDSGDAVFNHQAVFRRRAHRARREQEKIGTRLPLSDLGGGKNVRREQALVAGHPKRETHSFRRARRGDAHARAQTLDRLAHAFDAFQFVREGGQYLVRKIVGKFLGQRRPEFCFGDSQDRIEAHSEEPLARLLIGQAKARLAKPAAGDAERDHLAVDQNPVAIENDQFRPAGLVSKFANLPLGLTEHLKGVSLSRMERGDRSACRRRCARRDRRHRRHGGGHGLPSRRDRAHHRRAEKHRLQSLGRFDNLAAHIRNDLADQGASRGAAADDNGIECVSGKLELAHDVGEAIARGRRVRRHRAPASSLGLRADQSPSPPRARPGRPKATSRR